MKEFFFTCLALSIPLIALGAVVYLFFRGIWVVINDWRLARELEDLRTETRQRSESAGRPPREKDRISEALLGDAALGLPPAIMVVPLESPIARRPAAPRAEHRGSGPTKKTTSTERTQHATESRSDPLDEETRTMPDGEPR